MNTKIHPETEEFQASLQDAGMNGHAPIVTRSGFKFTSSSIIDLTTVEDTPIDWLVYPYLIRGAITSIEGESDMAKSLVMTDFAARLTTDRPFPDGLIRSFEGKQGVVFITYEDDIAQAIKPRFVKAGGDESLIKPIRFVDDGNGPRGLDLTRAGDLELLEYAIEQVHAALVIIDPITSALGNTDINQTGDVRNALLPLAEVATRHGVAVANLRHHRKSNEGGFKQKGIGSMAFQEMARVGLAFSYDPQDDTGDTRLITGFKHNYSGQFKSVKFTVSGGQNVTPAIQWQGVSELSEKQILESSKPMGAVKQSILKLIAEVGGTAETRTITNALEEQGESAGNVRKQLRELVTSGKLVSQVYGVYSLAA